MLRTAKGYVENAAAQKLFAFVNHLDNEDAIRIAAECNVHFGTGLGFNAPIFTGLEAVPDFPLTLPG